MNTTSEPTGREDSTAAATRRSVLRAAAIGGAAAAPLVAAIPGAAAAQSGAAAPTVAPPAPARAGGQVREYWIQVDSFLHNTVPTGLDEMSGTTYTADQTSYWALGYRAYTPNWGEPLPGDTSNTPDSIGPNTGIPGPTIRAEVGDTLKVHFRNNDAHYKCPHSMHPHGVLYNPDNDGAYIWATPNTPGTAVPYGESYTYTWTALPSSVGTWPYHDHSVDLMLKPGNMVMEISAELGMFGIIAITDESTPRVDKEFVLFFHDLYQADVPLLAQDVDCFNGYAFLGNTPTFTSTVGDRVRWRVAALGKEFHVFHTHGHRWFNGLKYVDSEVLGPSTTLTVDYVEDNPGPWLYHCHVTDHMAGGMVGRYMVNG
jgi:FtsP/CotA-like multicopper oxidase with cupredoxin domain